MIIYHIFYSLKFIFTNQLKKYHNNFKICMNPMNENCPSYNIKYNKDC